MFIAHSPLGLIQTHYTNSIWNKKNILSEKDITKVYMFSMVSSILPDFDLAFSFLYRLITNKFIHHHTFLTHSLLFYIGLSFISLLILLFFIKENKQLIRIFIFIFFITTTTHILFDAIGSNMQLLYPFSNKNFTLLGTNPIINSNNIILQYIFTPVLSLIEIILVIISLYIVLFKFRNQKFLFKYTSLTLMIISIISILTTVIFVILD
jgi:hypothetical protein